MIWLLQAAVGNSQPRQEDGTVVKDPQCVTLTKCIGGVHKHTHPGMPLHNMSGQEGHHASKSHPTSQALTQSPDPHYSEAHYHRFGQAVTQIPTPFSITLSSLTLPTPSVQAKSTSPIKKLPQSAQCWTQVTWLPKHYLSQVQ